MQRLKDSVVLTTWETEAGFFEPKSSRQPGKQEDLITKNKNQAGCGGTDSNPGYSIVETVIV
jgi:hypothetical protein